MPQPLPDQLSGPCTRSVCIGGDDLHFECAHFIVQRAVGSAGDSPRKLIKEPLHGHSYRVEVQLWGDMMDDGFVMDFRGLRKEAKRLCREWSHHVILPLLSPCLKIQLKTKEKSSDNLRFSYYIETSDGDEYLFPQADCLPLSIKHSSSEELAEAFWIEYKSRIADELIERKISLMRVTIHERSGCCSIFEWPVNQKVKRALSKSTSIKEET
eukprot:Protomagalhaensia_wolfi_Nauph_80__1084@NODE_1632_length_1431_cov_594_989224_g1264_i0_p1_GENE_NODE_1632_length_1431_cov_594_989224_g1264_i0NODE_1632_length_1431_cov_594_989224_g1264_i0_p1_ORF_typecomplete_len212_score23_93PTPS/PF01242_19/1_3e19REGB_T4/PF10715_9/0_18_NODE_1632_length_1431_cov_594_989224_g1264_i04721107